MSDEVERPAIVAIGASGVAHRVVTTPPAATAEEAAELQGIPLDALLRTIVVRRGPDDYVFVVLGAGRQFSWPKLRAHLGVNRLSLPDADEAQAVTGYVRYTITPFGSTTAWPVFVDAAVAEQPVVSIGGGVRGTSFHLNAADLVSALGATVVDLA
jgi:Cys-tRNA(Pro)/Cys-tRNA(Cys) deacylase